MTEPITRRTILAGAGAITGAAALPVTSADGDTNSNNNRGGPKRHDQNGRVCTLPCDARDVGDMIDCDWVDSSATFRNCGDCPGKVTFWVTGSLSTDPRVDEPDQRRAEIHLQPGAKSTVYFNGRVNNLAIDTGDVNVGISQRAPNENCEDTCDTC